MCCDADAELFAGPSGLASPGYIPGAAILTKLVYTCTMLILDTYLSWLLRFESIFQAIRPQRAFRSWAGDEAVSEKGKSDTEAWVRTALETDW